MIEKLSKFSKEIQKEIVEFQDEKHRNSIYYLIQNQMDFILNFLVKSLGKEILTIQGENSETPLILAMKKVIQQNKKMIDCLFAHK